MQVAASLTGAMRRPVPHPDQIGRLSGLVRKRNDQPFIVHKPTLPVLVLATAVMGRAVLRGKTKILHAAVKLGFVDQAGQAFADHGAAMAGIDPFPGITDHKIIEPVRVATEFHQDEAVPQAWQIQRIESLLSGQSAAAPRHAEPIGQQPVQCRRQIRRKIKAFRAADLCPSGYRHAPVTHTQVIRT